MAKPSRAKGAHIISALGIMSGTSLDGVDFVQIEIQKTGKKTSLKYLGMKSFDFPEELSRKLHECAEHKLKVNELAVLHHELGRFYATSYKKLPPAFRRSQIIGLHGQTVFHGPPQATLQIGEPSYLASMTSALVVSDFRVGDLAYGGQGAPLATWFHYAAFSEHFKGNNFAFQNLGGIANVSFFSAGSKMMSFDTGPANMLLDLAIHKGSGGQHAFDKDGDLARSGQIRFGLVEKFLNHPFLSAKPPKSCGREEFGETFWKQHSAELLKLPLADQLATLTEFTAQSIALQYTNYLPKKLHLVVCAGGGTKNKFLIERLSKNLEDMEIFTSEDFGWPTQSIEGAAFAFLAYERLQRNRYPFYKSTGATKAALLGKIVEI